MGPNPEAETLPGLSHFLKNIIPPGGLYAPEKDSILNSAIQKGEILCIWQMRFSLRP